MAEDELRAYYNGINNLWEFMKEFLQREDYKTNEQAYWDELIARAGEYTKGENDFIKLLFFKAMDEIAKVTRPCGEES